MSRNSKVQPTESKAQTMFKERQNINTQYHHVKKVFRLLEKKRVVYPLTVFLLGKCFEC